MSFCATKTSPVARVGRDCRACWRHERDEGNGRRQQVTYTARARTQQTARYAPAVACVRVVRWRHARAYCIEAPSTTAAAARSNVPKSLRSVRTRFLLSSHTPVVCSLSFSNAGVVVAVVATAAAAARCSSHTAFSFFRSKQKQQAHPEAFASARAPRTHARAHTNENKRQRAGSFCRLHHSNRAPRAPAASRNPQRAAQTFAISKSRDRTAGPSYCCVVLLLLLSRLAGAVARRRQRATTIVTACQPLRAQTQTFARKEQAADTNAAVAHTAAATAAFACVSRTALVVLASFLLFVRATLATAKLLVLRCERRLHSFRATATAGETARLLHPFASADALGATAVTTGNLLTAPVVVLTGLSAMREPELRQSDQQQQTVALLNQEPTGNPPLSPSSPSTHAMSAASPHATLTVTDKREDPTDAVTSPLLNGSRGSRRISPFPEHDAPIAFELPVAATTTTSTTTRSLTSTQDLDTRRSSFSAMAAGNRAQLRRRSHDFTDFASLSLPTQPLQTSVFLQGRPRTTNGLLRAYNTKSESSDGKTTLTAQQTSGDALVDVVCPTPRTVWRRGQPVCIEWKVLDATVETVQIDLMEDGSSATTTIATAAPNNGFFTYTKVPWGMQCGSTYFLRVRSTADASRFMTTPFFHIGSAP